MKKAPSRKGQKPLSVTPSEIQIRAMRARLRRQVQAHQDIKRLAKQLTTSKSSADAALFVTSMDVCRSNGYAVVPLAELEQLRWGARRLEAIKLAREVGNTDDIVSAIEQATDNVPWPDDATFLETGERLKRPALAAAAEV